MSRASYQKLKVAELRDSLAALNLSTEGTKPFLVERLSNAIEKNKPRITIGKDAKTMDILTRLNPIYAAKLIYKQMKSLLK
jgi:hypothetical protein